MISVWNRRILVHAESENVFLDNMLLLAAAAVEDFHGEMSRTSSEKWVYEEKAPDLPCASVIMLENAVYRSVHVDKLSLKYCVKKDIIEWLKRNDLSCDFPMRREALFMSLMEN
jgi:hypothetical protein